MEKEILKDHWITKDLGLEVFIHPEEVCNWIYIRTSNGFVHRFHRIFVEDKPNFKPVIEDLNNKTYGNLLMYHKYAMDRIQDYIQMYYVSGDVNHLNQIQYLIKESKKTF